MGDSAQSHINVKLQQLEFEGNKFDNVASTQVMSASADYLTISFGLDALATVYEVNQNSIEVPPMPSGRHFFVNLGAAYALTLLVWHICQHVATSLTVDHFLGELVKDLYKLEPIVHNPPVDTYNVSFDDIKREVFGYGRPNFIVE